MDDYTSYEGDSTRFFYEVFDENGIRINKFICIETVTNTGVGANSDQTHTTIKIYNVPIYDHRHDTYTHRDKELFIGDVWFVNASKCLTNKKYSHIDICKSNFTTITEIFRSLTYVNPAEIQTLNNTKLLPHSDHHFLPPGLTETELQNFIKSNWSQIYNSDYNYEFFHKSGANSGIMREVHNVKVEKNVVTNKYRYTTAGKSKSNITPSTINVDNVNHTYTGTLSSSTYSGYKLAANSNRIVSAGNQTLTGYTGNNITLAISGNAVSVTNSKTSTNRTTELQNFIKSNWREYYNAASVDIISDQIFNNFATPFVIRKNIISPITRYNIHHDISISKIDNVESFAFGDRVKVYDKTFSIGENLDEYYNYIFKQMCLTKSIETVYTIDRFLDYPFYIGVEILGGPMRSNAIKVIRECTLVSYDSTGVIIRLLPNDYFSSGTLIRVPYR